MNTGKIQQQHPDGNVGAVKILLFCVTNAEVLGNYLKSNVRELNSHFHQELWRIFLMAIPKL